MTPSSVQALKFAKMGFSKGFMELILRRLNDQMKLKENLKRKINYQSDQSNKKMFCIN